MCCRSWQLLCCRICSLCAADEGSQCAACVGSQLAMCVMQAQKLHVTAACMNTVVIRRQLRCARGDSSDWRLLMCCELVTAQCAFMDAVVHAD